MIDKSSITLEQVRALQDRVMFGSLLGSIEGLEDIADSIVGPLKDILKDRDTWKILYKLRVLEKELEKQ